jgi:molybdopterin converting factor small subunit
MKLHVQFYAQLRDLAGAREMEVELPENSTARDLLAKVYDERPALRAHDKSILIGAGLEFVERNHVLQPDEEISIMPPVQGG